MVDGYRKTEDGRLPDEYRLKELSTGYIKTL
jgi:hypothetical protein